MSRKDYIAVAKVIADVMDTIRRDVDAGNGPDLEADAVLLNVAYGLSSVFREDNPSFDMARFITACDLDNMIPSEAFHSA